MAGPVPTVVVRVIVTVSHALEGTLRACRSLLPTARTLRCRS
jgi:hypothetical protein